MREVVHLTASQARRVPWKNGRGVTEELALWPPGASLERGDFEWRISRAAVESAGPFSKFDGCERLLVVTAGDGLVLDHGEAAPRARVRRLEPYRFSGDWPTSAALSGGVVRDFNVLTRRGRWRADVDAVRLGMRKLREPLSTPHSFALVLAGAATARVSGEEEHFELAAGDSLWMREPRAGDEIELAGASNECELLFVRIDAVRTR